MSEISEKCLIYQNIFDIFVLYHKIFIYSYYTKNVKSNVLNHRGIVAAILSCWFPISVSYKLNIILKIQSSELLQINTEKTYNFIEFIMWCCVV